MHLICIICLYLYATLRSAYKLFLEYQRRQGCGLVLAVAALARYNKIRGKRWWTWDGSMLQCCSGETGGRSAVQEKNSWAVLLRLLYETAMAMMSELKHTTPPSNYTIYLKE